MTGQEVRQQRIAAGLSTSQLSGLSGLPEAAVVFFETQARIPKSSLRALRRGLWAAARERALAAAPVPPCPSEQAFAARGWRDAGAFAAHVRGCTECRARRDHVFAAAGPPPMPLRTERLLARMDRLPWPFAAAGQGAVAVTAAAMPVALLTLVIGVIAEEGELAAAALVGLVGAAVAGLVGGALYGAVRRLVPATYAGAWAAWMALGSVVGVAVYAFLLSEVDHPGDGGQGLRVAVGTAIAAVAAGMAWVTWRLEAVRLPWAGGPARPTWRPFRALALAGLAAAMVGPILMGILLLIAESASVRAAVAVPTDTVAVLPPPLDPVGMPWRVEPEAAMETMRALHAVSPEAARRFAASLDAIQPGLALTDELAGLPERPGTPVTVREEEILHDVRVGQEAYDAGRWEVALASYRRAAFRDPGRADVWIRRAEAARALGEVEEARLSVMAAQALNAQASMDGRVQTLGEELGLPVPALQDVEEVVPPAQTTDTVVQALW